MAARNESCLKTNRNEKGISLIIPCISPSQASCWAPRNKTSWTFLYRQSQCFGSVPGSPGPACGSLVTATSGVWVQRQLQSLVRQSSLRREALEGGGFPLGSLPTSIPRRLYGGHATGMVPQHFSTAKPVGEAFTPTLATCSLWCCLLICNNSTVPAFMPRKQGLQRSDESFFKHASILHGVSFMSKETTEQNEMISNYYLKDMKYLPKLLLK